MSSKAIKYTFMSQAMCEAVLFFFLSVFKFVLLERNKRLEEGKWKATIYI